MQCQADVAGGGADVDPAAETQLAYRVADRRRRRLLNAPFSATPADQAGTDDFALDFSAFDRPAAPPETPVATRARISATSHASTTLSCLPGRCHRGASRGAGGALPNRLGRSFAARALNGAGRRPATAGATRLTPAPGAARDDETGVPRAFEQARPTPVSRPVA